MIRGVLTGFLTACLLVGCGVSHGPISGGTLARLNNLAVTPEQGARIMEGRKIATRSYPPPGGVLRVPMKMDGAGLPTVKVSLNGRRAEDILLDTGATVTVLDAALAVRNRIATVPSLKGETVDVTARRMFAEWGVGSAKTNRGVLVLIAPIERKARIEVGCGLETVVTNEAAQQIMDDAMLPRFKAGDFDAGTTGAVEALITRIDTANVAGGPVSPSCRAIMKDAA